MPEGRIEVGAFHRLERGEFRDYPFVEFIDIDICRVTIIEGQRQRRETQLPARAHAQAEITCRCHAGKQILRYHFTISVLGEVGNRIVVPDPLLQHLRRCLDKIPFGVDAADIGPSMVACKHPVNQVTEFMQERDHLAVLHQVVPGREVAD